MSLIDKYSKEELENMVKNSFSYKELCEKIGYKTSCGGNNYTIKKKLSYFNINIDHFTHTRDYEFNEEDVFKENSKVSRKALKKRFLKIVDYKCDICGISKWNDRDITLTLDHINGINNDNRIDNLRLLCPNCDSQQKTFRGANIKRLHKKYYCKECGTEISNRATLCPKCEAERRKNNSIINERVSREELKTLIRTKSFKEIGNMFGFSDNTIRKWCTHYGLPNKSKYIKQIKDEEWDLI